ncbi:MAG: hypothetical protein ACLU3I_22745 [Acutalibacteraceae bacterium]
MDTVVVSTQHADSVTIEQICAGPSSRGDHRRRSCRRDCIDENTQILCQPDRPLRHRRALRATAA